MEDKASTPSAPQNTTNSISGGLNFSQALEALKIHVPMARKGWNGVGLSVRIQVPDENSKMSEPYFYITAQADNVEIPTTRVPWLPSQTDLLAEDWYTV